MRRALFAVVFAALLAPAIDAAPKNKRNKNAQIVFQDHESRIIRDYFRNTNGLPPGLAKRNGNLPPGLEKHLRRNGQLPPGLQKKVSDFPVDLNRRLPRLPDIFRRGMIGDRAIIYDPTTMMIHDMINIFAGVR